MAKKEKIKILHVTPHLGGGVGTVVGGYLKRSKSNEHFVHSVVCLDYMNPYAKELLTEQQIDFKENVGRNISAIYKDITEADIVLVHWWNHPFIFNFLLDQNLPDCRMITWSHVSGLYPPDVFVEKLIQLPDLLVFTSPVSFNSKEINSLPEHLSKKLRTIWSVGENEHFYNLPKIPHRNFNIGLTGTVDKSKLHPDFIDMCKNVKIPEAKFIICSGDSQERLIKEAAEKGISEKFEFMGRVESIVPYLQIYDVFGYPLQPNHFGTCEQALGEAMLAGLVPVVLNNPTESLIVKNGVDGIVVNTTDEYSRAIEYLFNNPDKRKIMSENAKDSAKKRYSLDNTVKEWEKTFSECLQFPKSPKRWEIQGQMVSGSVVFLESLGNEYRSVFEDYNKAVIANTDLSIQIKKIKDFFESNLQWKSNSKGSIQQYIKFFPEDELLKKWAEI